MDDESWLCYVRCSNILIMKMMFFIWQTGRIRVYRNVIHSETDRIFMQEPVILDVTGGGHPDVDRIRAAHRSDVETVIPFLLITLLWLESSPPPCTVKLVLWSFSIARILHGICYMDVLPNLPHFVKIFISLLSHSIITYVAACCVYNFA